MSGIIWLASYPKSGNTWFRVFLANLLGDSDEPASINRLGKTPIASSRLLFDDEIGFEASDLTADEIDRLRPELYIHLAQKVSGPVFMKIHDAFLYLDDNRPLIPQDATAGALYFIRNPLDVAVSFAHHSGWDYDTTISRMADDGFTSCEKKDRLHNQLRQKLLSWSGHAESWVDQTPFDVQVVRYEDMLQNPFETFATASRVVGLDPSDDEILRALEHSSFQRLRAQEEAEGFIEKHPSASTFFRSGKIGSWREELNCAQVRRIVHDHGQVMRRFGYLGEQGEVLDG